MGTSQRLSSSTGGTAWSAKYKAFGEASTDISSLQQNLRFPGQYLDAETGLYQNYFRDYEPLLGRYVQSDPIGIMGGLNTYDYSMHNPLNYIDPKGLLTPLGAGLGALCTAIVAYNTISTIETIKATNSERIENVKGIVRDVKERKSSCPSDDISKLEKLESIDQEMSKLLYQMTSDVGRQANTGTALLNGVSQEIICILMVAFL